MHAFDLHVFSVLPRLPGTSPRPELLQVDLHALFDRDLPLSLPRFWHDGSGGLMHVNTTVHRGLDLEVTADQMALFTKGGGRVAASMEVLRLLAADGRELPRGGLLAIFMGGIGVDLGAATFAFGGHSFGVAYLPMSATHKDMAHELGHVFGLDHPYDLRLPPPLKNQEYGDVTDIMGGQAGWYTVDPSDRPFAPTQNLWSRVGAGPSPISLWRFLPGFPAIPDWVKEIAPDAPPTWVDLHALEGSRPGPVKLVVMRSDRGAGWYSVQYKVRRGWDTGIYSIHPGIPGVVQIHELRDVVWPLPDDTTKVVPLRPCLVGEIIPGTGGTDWSNGRLSVRVRQFGDTHASIQVGHWLEDARSVVLDSAVEAVPYQTEPTGETVEISRVGPRCGKKSYAVVQTFYNVEAAVKARWIGFRDPVVRFEVNGHRLGDWKRPATDPKDRSGLEILDVDMLRPTSLGKVVAERVPRSVAWDLHPDGLRLIAPQDSDDPRTHEGRYEVTVRVLASESPGNDATAVEATEKLTFTTRSIELPSVVVQDQAACLLQHLHAAVDERPQMMPLEDPDWQVRTEGLEAMLLRDLVKVRPDAMRLLRAGAAQLPTASHSWAELAALLGVSPEVLREAARQLPAPP